MKAPALLLSLFLFLTVISRLSAQDENYDAVYQSMTKIYTLNEDQTIDYRCIKELKLQNYRSFHRLYGETFVVFNPTYQRMTVNEAYTIMADGKKVVTPGNAFNEVLPGFAGHAPAFNGLREMVITHTGLEIGSSIFLDYQIHTDAGFFPAFMGSVVLAEEQPVKHMKIVIRTPEDKPLYVHLFNHTMKPAETLENGFKTYTWVMKNAGAIEDEPNPEVPAGVYPSLMFSSLNTYKPLVGFFLEQDAFRYQTTPEMNGFTEGLVKESEKKQDLLFAIQERVVKDINLFAVPMELTGYRLRTPSQVWKSNGGTESEKAVLLTALLRKAGFEAAPVMVVERAWFDEKIPALNNLAGWIVRTNLPGTGTIYLSVTENNAFDMTSLMAGQVFIVMEPDPTPAVIFPRQEKNLISLNGKFVISPDEFHLSGEISVTLTNRCNPELALLRKESKIKSYFSDGLSAGDISEVKQVVLSPGRADFVCQIQAGTPFKKNGNYYVYHFPRMKTGSETWGITGLSTQRKTPLKIPYTVEETYDLTIAIPDSLTVVVPANMPRIDNETGSCSFIIEQRGGTIHIKMELSLKDQMIPPEKYAGFKLIMDHWNLIWKNGLILQTRGK